MDRKELNVYNIKKIKFNNKDLNSNIKNNIYKELYNSLFIINNFLNIPKINKNNHISISFCSLPSNWNGCYNSRNNNIKIQDIYTNTEYISNIKTIFYHEYGHYIYEEFYIKDYFNLYNLEEDINKLIDNLLYMPTLFNIDKDIKIKMQIFDKSYYNAMNKNEKYLLTNTEIFARFFSSFLLYFWDEHNKLDFSITEIEVNKHLLDNIFSKINLGLQKNKEKIGGIL